MNDILFLNLANIRDLEKDAIFTRMPDLALVYLGEYLANKGYKVEVFDEHVDGRIDDNLRLFVRAKFIGISMYGLNNQANLTRIHNWKEMFPSAKFILGGSSVGHDITDKPDFIDHIVIGSGYQPLIGIIKGRTSGLILGSTGSEEDFPASFKLTPLEKYNSAALLTSFGCPFKCYFCLSPKLKNFKIRKKENVFQELDLVLSSDIKYFEFFDDIFTLCPYMDELLDKVSKGNKRWGCVVDSRHTNEKFRDILAKMIDSGLTTIGFGFESINDNTLQALNKKLTTEDIEWSLKTVKELSSNDLRPHAFLMYGLPLQTGEDHLRDIDKVKSYGFDTQSTHLKVIKGTELWNIRGEFGIETDDNGLVTKTSHMTEEQINELDQVMSILNKESIAKIWRNLL